MQYGTACGLDRTAYQSTATVTDVTANIITHDGSYTSGTLIGGLITAGTERRWITANSSNTITVMGAFVGITAASPIIILPGCQHDITKCRTVYSNLNNYGGFPFIPRKNPFQVSLLG